MKFGLYANIKKKLFWKHLPEFLSWFRKNNLAVVLSQTILEHSPFKIRDFQGIPDEQLPGACDMILAFGGDGTFLQTVQIVGKKETPILGINVGGLGFLTEIPLEQFEIILQQIVAGNYTIERRTLIEGTIEGDPAPLYALNEIVIDKGRSTRVIEIEIEVDQRYLNAYIADGLIFSTPTGSTGYSLSSGGPIVVPASPVFIINPICPHSLTNRPVILPDTVSVGAEVRTEYSEVIIAADGRDIRYAPRHTRLSLKKAPFHAHLVKHEKSDYFAILRNKLHWGEDFRDRTRWSYTK